jgi:hypothetical protein
MKLVIFMRLIIFFLVLTSISLEATVWEVGFRTRNQGNFYSESVRIYLFNTTSKNYDLVVSTATHSEPGGCGLGLLYNGAFDWIEADSNTCNAICSPLPVGDYIIRIANKFIIMERTGGDIYDLAFQYEDGEMSVYMDSGGFNFYGPYTWTDYSILLKNNFVGGDMWINNLMYWFSVKWNFVLIK